MNEKKMRFPGVSPGFLPVNLGHQKQKPPNMVNTTVPNRT
jgi:hypothetical protein